MVLVLLLGFPFVAFPAGQNAASGVRNLYVHLLGFALGFTVTYATFEVWKLLPEDRFPT
jgi:hypothetical protein